MEDLEDSVSNEIAEAAKQDKFKDARSRILKAFTVNRQGKDFVLYAGLLALAHEMGLRELSTEIVQFPCDENHWTAIVRATATMNNDGDMAVFTDHADANGDNVGRMIAAHYIRMACTRAKARALRDATNVGMTSLEELGDKDEKSATQRMPRSTPYKSTDEIEPAAERIRSVVPLGPSDLATAQQRAELNRLFSKANISGKIPENVTVAQADNQIKNLKKKVGE